MLQSYLQLAWIHGLSNPNGRVELAVGDGVVPITRGVASGSGEPHGGEMSASLPIRSRSGGLECPLVTTS